MSNSVEKILAWIEQQLIATGSALDTNEKVPTFTRRYIEGQLAALNEVMFMINRSSLPQEEMLATRKLQPTFGEVQGTAENQRYDVYIASGGEHTLHPRIALEVEKALAGLPIKPKRLFVVNNVTFTPRKLDWDDL